jgi:hypothetical protein
MERIGLRSSDPKPLRDDWLQVAAWMQEIEEEVDDLETLATDDLRLELRAVP